MVHDFRKNGYVPEVLNNFLALFGWSPGGDLEQMSIDQMVEKFGLDRLISANSKFNRDKLKSFSTDYFAKASSAQLIAHLRDYLKVNPSSPLNNATDEQLAKVLSMNAGFHILSEVDEKSAFLFATDEAIEYAPDAVEKVLLKNDRQGLTALRELRDVLANATEWTSHDALEATVKSFCDAKGLGLGKVAQPLRVALSGTAVSPPIFDCLAFLGKEKTLARIDRCVTKVG